MTPEQEGIQILFDRMTAEQLRLDLQEAQETIKDKDCELEVRALYTRNTNAERDAARLALQESQQETEAIKQELRLTRGLEERLEQSQQRVKELEQNYQALAAFKDFQDGLKNELLESRQQRDCANAETEALKHAVNSWIHENEKWKEQRDQQQAALQQLAEALRMISKNTYCDGPGCQYCESETPHPESLSAAQARAALAKTAPWLRKEGE